MLQLEYNGIFLHLLEGSAIEIDKSSTLFALDNVLAEYTLPITIRYDDHNVSALGDLFFDYGVKAKKKLAVNIYDAGSYCSAAVLVVDKNLVDHNVRGRGNVQGYVLTGISDFFSTIKGRKLNMLYFDGVRSFPFTSWDPSDGSNGWWQHFHATWDGSQDYVMIPHRNETWIEEEWFDGWVNQLGVGYVGGMAVEPPGRVEDGSWIVLFPYLKYVLRKLFEENGWQLDTAGLNDTDWQKLLLFNVNPIATTHTVDGSGSIAPVSRLSFQIADMISPEIYCTDFLLWVCNRYGWAPIFDSDTKICRLVSLKDSTTGTLKDFTQYAAGEVNTDFSQDLRKFNFVNNLPANDAYLSSPDFTNYKKQPPVASFAALPTPSLDYDTSVIFAFKENAFYKIEVDEDGNRVWIKHSENVYNYEQDGNTDSIETGCSTMPVQLSQYRQTAAGVNYYGYFPICKNPRNKEWGMRTLFYHGLVLEQDADGAAGSMSYPLASPLAVLPDGSFGTAWSNVYEHDNGSDNYGIITYWWAQWLRLLKVSNVVEMILNLPLHELAALRWDDVINIKNQPYLLKKYIEPRPYKGFIQATLHPLLLDDNDAAIADLGASEIFVKVTYENLTPGSSPYFADLVNCDVVVRVYSDAAGTIPAMPGSLNIDMALKVTNTPGMEIIGATERHLITASANTIYTEQIREYNAPDGSGVHSVWSYIVLPGTGYTPI